MYSMKKVCNNSFYDNIKCCNSIETNKFKTKKSQILWHCDRCKINNFNDESSLFYKSSSFYMFNFYEEIAIYYNIQRIVKKLFRQRKQFYLLK